MDTRATKTTQAWRTALTCGVAAASLWACATPQEGAAARQLRPESAAVAGGAGQPAGAGVALAAARPAPPLRLLLEGQERGDGCSEVVARVVVVAGRLPGAPVLRLHLPAGAELLAGTIEETLRADDGAAPLERRFVVRRGGKAVRWTVDALSAGAGARAEAVYPAELDKPPATAPGGPAFLPLPPVQLRGVTIEGAVPIGARPDGER